jgi:hypothetical protein
MKTTLKLKINPIRLYLGLIFYPRKLLAGLFILIKYREAIALNLCIETRQQCCGSRLGRIRILFFFFL